MNERLGSSVGELSSPILATTRKHNLKLAFKFFKFWC